MLTTRTTTAEQAPMAEQIGTGNRDRRGQGVRHARLRFRLIYLAALALIGMILLVQARAGGLRPASSSTSSPLQQSSNVTTESSPISSQSTPNSGEMRGGITVQLPAPPPPAPPAPPMAPTPPNTNCISFGGIDWGACLTGLGNAIMGGISSAITGIIDWATSFGFLFVTPAALTYKHGVVANLWQWSLGVVDAALVLFLVIGGYNAMVRHAIGARYHDILEFLPRLVLAAVAANFSLMFISSFIELNNTLNISVMGALATAGAGNVSLPFGILNIVTLPFYEAILYLIDLLFALLLVIQQLVRIALLDVLTILAPIGLFCLALPQTQRWGRLWALGFTATLFLQFLQVLVIGIGSALVASFGHASATPISLLVGGAALYLAFKIPGMLYGTLLRPIEGAGADAANAADRIATVVAAAV